MDAIFNERKLSRQSEEIKILSAKVDSLKFSIYLDSIDKATEQYFKKQLNY
jgi:hypothetical protein